MFAYASSFAIHSTANPHRRRVCGVVRAAGPRLTTKPELRPASPDVSRPSENDQFWAEHPERMVRLQLTCVSSHEPPPADGTDSSASGAGLGSWALPGGKGTSCSQSTQPGTVPDQPLQQQGSGPGVSILLDAAAPEERTSQAGAGTQRVSASRRSTAIVVQAIMSHDSCVYQLGSVAV